MVVYDFDGCKLSKKTYGGHSCSKIGIESGGYYYMLKFPDNLKVKNMKNIDISYSNSPVCEYLGSHIYQTLDIPVHETYLGYRGGKLSVACLDFSDGVIEKSPFSEIKTTMEPAFYSPNGTATDGTSGDLKEVIQTLQTHPIFQDIPDAETRFWDMFIVDAFIGNTDRNNENWGVLQYPDHDEMMPVYDNGNCLNNKWSENQMLRVMNDPKSLKAESYDARRCFFTENGKRMNPYHYIMNQENQECNDAVRRLVPKIDLTKIYGIINDMEEAGVISETMSNFYKCILTERYEQVLLPTYQEICAAEYSEAIADEEDNIRNLNYIDDDFCL